MTLNGLICAEVLLRGYSLTHSLTHSLRGYLRQRAGLTRGLSTLYYGNQERLMLKHKQCYD